MIAVFIAVKTVALVLRKQKCPNSWAAADISWVHHALQTVGTTGCWCYTFSASVALDSEMMHQSWHTVWATEWSKNNDSELN
jgi:hypothetical protein